MGSRILLADDSITIQKVVNLTFADEGMERCHVAQSSTTDLRTFTPAVVVFDGKADGWIGMCSPDVHRIGDKSL